MDLKDLKSHHNHELVCVVYGDVDGQRKREWGKAR